MKAIRLTGGLDRCSGKVEIHRNGTWGTVCDNCWNKDMASLVCSMLQCGAEPVKFTQFDPPLTHNNGTLWYYICRSDTQSLWQCRELNLPHLCKDSKASGVICNGEPCSFCVIQENLSIFVKICKTGQPGRNIPFILFYLHSYRKLEIVLNLTLTLFHDIMS